MVSAVFRQGGAWARKHHIRGFFFACLGEEEGGTPTTQDMGDTHAKKTQARNSEKNLFQENSLLLWFRLPFLTFSVRRLFLVRACVRVCVCMCSPGWRCLPECAGAASLSEQEPALGRLCCRDCLLLLSCPGRRTQRPSSTHVVCCRSLAPPRLAEGSLVRASIQPLDV